MPSQSDSEGLDGTHLMSKYQGILLAATAIDGNGCIFPVAFGIVDAENDANWLWFLTHLKRALETVNRVRSIHALYIARYSSHLICSFPSLQPPDITFLSDRQKGLVDGVATAFPDCHHAFCLKHLTENFHRKFKNNTLTKLAWQAAWALTESGFDKVMMEIKQVDPNAEAWLHQTNPAFWANAHFAGNRFNHLTSNIAESLNSWILDAREKPAYQMVEDIRKKLMEWMVSRKAEADTPGDLVPTVEKRIGENKTAARRYQGSRQHDLLCGRLPVKHPTTSSTWRHGRVPVAIGSYPAFLVRMHATQS
jgi:hypothetical protein